MKSGREEALEWMGGIGVPPAHCNAPPLDLDAVEKLVESLYDDADREDMIATEAGGSSGAGREEMSEPAVVGQVGAEARTGVRVGELIPIHGAWWKVAAAGEKGIILTPHSLTTQSLKRARAAEKRERGKRWRAAGRRIT